MKLEEIKEVKLCYSEVEVNSNLKDGFTIKKIIQSRSNGDDIVPTFILVK